MPTLQELFDIAARYATTMARAMMAACVCRHYATGEPLSVTRARPVPVPAPAMGPWPAPEDDVDWERMMRENSDTRWNHC